MSGTNRTPVTPGGAPAPPAYTTPPSNAEMATEVQQLRALVQTLQRQVQNQPAVAPAATTNNDRDPGETIKPPKPEPFDGSPSDVIPFITRMKGYFRFFPRRLASSEARLLFTNNLMIGNAKDWFEPIMRDFLNNDEASQDQDTVNIFADWENFEEALKDTFGMVNEERQAATKIHKIKQMKSTAAYAIAFRQVASKLEWDDDVLMEIFYQGLKEEVKDELYKADRPDTLTEYITMAVKIDERQYERRREKAENQRGGRGNNYNPYYPKNQDNRKNKNRVNTSYGTRAGPMELGAAQRDYSKVKCWNCGKMGHFENKCQSPKTNQKHKPVPEGKNLRSTNHQHPSKTLAMTRSGYHGMFSGAGEDMIDSESEPETTEQRDKIEARREARRGEWARRLAKETPEEKQARLVRKGESARRRYAERKAAREANKQWDPIPEGRPTKNTVNGKILAMVKKGDRRARFAPVPEDGESYRQKVEEEIPDRQPSQVKVDYNQVGNASSATFQLPKTRAVQTNDDCNCRQTGHTKNECPASFSKKGKQIWNKLHDNEKPKRGSKRQDTSTSKRYEPSRDGTTEGRQRLETHRFLDELSQEPELILAPADEYPDSSDDERTDPYYEEYRESPTEAKEWWNTAEIDPQGIRMWTSNEDRCQQMVRERQEPQAKEDLYIYARSRLEARGDEEIPRGEFLDDPRVRTDDPRHHELAWISCYDPRCEKHIYSKWKNDCFPTRLEDHPVSTPYLHDEIKGYRMRSFGPIDGIVILEYSNKFFPLECIKGPTNPMQCNEEDCLIHARAKIDLWHMQRDEWKDLMADCTERTQAPPTKNDKRHL